MLPDISKNTYLLLSVFPISVREAVEMQMTPDYVPLKIIFYRSFNFFTEISSISEAEPITASAKGKKKQFCLNLVLDIILETMTCYGIIWVRRWGQFSCIASKLLTSGMISRLTIQNIIHFKWPFFKPDHASATASKYTCSERFIRS